SMMRRLRAAGGRLESDRRVGLKTANEDYHRGLGTDTSPLSRHSRRAKPGWTSFDAGVPDLTDLQLEPGNPSRHESAKTATGHPPLVPLPPPCTHCLRQPRRRTVALSVT